VCVCAWVFVNVCFCLQVYVYANLHAHVFARVPVRYSYPCASVRAHASVCIQVWAMLLCEFEGMGSADRAELDAFNQAACDIKSAAGAGAVTCAAENFI